MTITALDIPGGKDALGEQALSANREDTPP